MAKTSGQSEIFARPLRLLASKPQLILAGVLNWIPQTLLLFLATFFLAANPELLDYSALLLLSQGASFPAILSALAPFIAMALAVLALGVVINAFVTLAYTAVVAQDGKGGLSASLSFASSRLKDYVYALAVAFAAFVAGGLAIVVFFMLAAIPAFNAVASAHGWMKAIALAASVFAIGPAVLLAMLFLLVASAAAFVFPAVVAIGGKKGVSAVRASLDFCFSHPLTVTISLAIVGAAAYVASILAGAVHGIPVAGFMAGQLLYLPLTAWSAMVAAELYSN